MSDREFEEIKHTPNDECEMAGLLVLTVYDFGTGEIEYHAGEDGDFARDVWDNRENPDDAILRQFWIRGYLVKERGLKSRL